MLYNIAHFHDVTFSDFFLVSLKETKQPEYLFAVATGEGVDATDAAAQCTIFLYV